jgi:hypothetical protein
MASEHSGEPLAGGKFFADRILRASFLKREIDHCPSQSRRDDEGVSLS